MYHRRPPWKTPILLKTHAPWQPPTHVITPTEPPRKRPLPTLCSPRPKQIIHLTPASAEVARAAAAGAAALRRQLQFALAVADQELIAVALVDSRHGAATEDRGGGTPERGNGVGDGGAREEDRNGREDELELHSGGVVSMGRGREMLYVRAVERDGLCWWCEGSLLGDCRTVWRRRFGEGVRALIFLSLENKLTGVLLCYILLRRRPNGRRFLDFSGSNRSRVRESKRWLSTTDRTCGLLCGKC
ncbi:hypothetical protein K402DRAFT_38989 [Aulographum hederae CBS 113979]|uniref:Uncharacterized protein n=1 Tax=Aulographum hederae CBS 113979 TaxID=1176131 RepID=A0A6G1H4N5_9PEZI|nr:hypothetical protein K402DRAFT_38989 [Aulographum hederae CBS 113979]